MFNSDWRGGFAVGLSIALLGMTGLVLWIFSVSYCPDAPCHYQKHPDQTETYNQRWFPLPWYPNATLQPKPPTAEGAPKDHEYGDLVAQESMARATNVIAWATIVSVMTAMIGVWLLISNLSLTRKTNQDQARAYVHAESVEFLWRSVGHTNPRIVVFVRNCGQTPAKWYRVRLKHIVFDQDKSVRWPESVDKVEFGEFSRSWNAISTGSDDLSTPFDFTDAEIPGIQSARNTALTYSGKSFAVFGEIEYCTFFGEVFLSQFCFGTHDLRSYRGDAPEKITLTPDEMPGMVNETRRKEHPIKLSRWPIDARTYEYQRAE